MDLDKYKFIRALRPFSFSVAFVVCAAGVSQAYNEGYDDAVTAFLIFTSAFLLQAGVNLINDYADLSVLKGGLSLTSRRRIKFNFRCGLFCLLLALAVGLYLIVHSTLALLGIGVVGVAGALGYTLEPINFKARGLGVVLVFWLMGVLMVVGSYIAMGGILNFTIVLVSVPVSMLTSLLLLSNELRDYQQDKAQGIRTLAVRIGFGSARGLFYILLLMSFITSVGLWWWGALHAIWPIAITLPLTLKPLLMVSAGEAKCATLPPLVGRLFMLFGLAFSCALILPA